MRSPPSFAASGCCSCSPTAGSPTPRTSAARTRSCPARPAASSAWPGPRRRPGFAGSSASTWAARPPTSPTSRASLNGSTRPRSPGCGCAPRCCRSTRSRPAAGPSRPSSAAGTRSAPTRRAPRPGPPATGMAAPAPAPPPTRFSARAAPAGAGARRGPACSGQGGPATVPAANVMLGRIQPASSPAVFGPSGAGPLDAGAARARFERLAADITAATGDKRNPEAVAAGFLEIAVANMANAIKKISVQRGYDITKYALSTFGGAGGQHACAVADALGMTSVLIHPLAGVLSAYGIGLADVVAMRESTIEAALTGELAASLPGDFAPLEESATAELTHATASAPAAPGHVPGSV